MKDGDFSYVDLWFLADISLQGTSNPWALSFARKTGCEYHILAGRDAARLLAKNKLEEKRGFRAVLPSGYDSQFAMEAMAHRNRWGKPWFTELKNEWIFHGELLNTQRVIVYVLGYRQHIIYIIYIYVQYIPIPLWYYVYTIYLEWMILI